jgi:hypothetical protein
MNTKTGILFVIFCVALASIVVGQRVQIRSVSFEAAQLHRELGELQERQRVLSGERANRANPAEMFRRVRAEGINLLPPEDNLPDIPGRPRVEREED